MGVINTRHNGWRSIPTPIPSEARSLLGLRLKMYGFIHTPRVLVKCRSARHIELLSIADFQIAKHGFLSSKEHRAATSQQICRIRDFISSPIFPITSCCFFVLLIHVKHGFLFAENLIPPTLCQFWRTALPLGSNVRPTKNGRPLLNRSYVADTFTNSHR